MDKALLLSQACNPLRAPHDRKIAWDAYESERDYELVHAGHLRPCDLPKDRADVVYRLIAERAT